MPTLPLIGRAGLVVVPRTPVDKQWQSSASC